jgi:hypothetical protein
MEVPMTLPKAGFRKGRIYHFAGKRWDKWTGKMVPYEMIIIGELVRSYVDPLERENDCRGVFEPDDRWYRVDDGHLPDHQPRVHAVDLPRIMGPKHVRFAYPV